ncbi:hypothetical protein BGZ65_003009 [Modicella reniformis]|uniref:holo-[acyl-carrier-protein] synthase n=1 Tax=Modicella reniformis TaxID=1440133 RepID=A0A9P6MBI8_9FUNG|nr:hypothetical protein BGZ65_003009 [Modicella reniformis]
MPIARWAFNIRQELLLEHIQPLVTSLTDSDKPNIVPATNLLTFLPKIECDRLLQFRAEDDTRRALIGRLMIHAFFVAYHDCKWEELIFSRSEGNKPILLEPAHLKDVSFNISHHGNWVILAGDMSIRSSVRIGVDVMDFSEQGEFETFSSCFQEQFTPAEFAYMNDAPHDLNAPTSTNNFRRFNRMWCLKESVVKALGTGIVYDLQSFEFLVHEEETMEPPVTSTKMRVHRATEDLNEQGWTFEEALLDDNHCYAIAAHRPGTDTEGGESILDGSKIQRLDWKELLKDARKYPVRFQY